MDFAFGEEQELLRASTRRFLDGQGGLAKVRGVIETDEVVDREEWRRGAQLGWTAMLVPVEHDGGSVTQQPLVDLLVLAEELGRVLHPGPFVPTNVVADAVVRFGTEDQHKGLLAPIARGEVLAAWCHTGDGSADDDAVDVWAERVDGAYRLDGVARYVHGATVADAILVAAKSPNGPLYALMTLPAEGVAVRHMTGLDVTRRFGDVRFDGAVVPAYAVMRGPGPAAEEVTRRALAVATVLQAAEPVGAAEHLVATTVQYAKDRIQFGRPIGSFQAIKHRLADLHITVVAMRAAAQYAALALSDDYGDAVEAVHVAGQLCRRGLQRRMR